MQFTLGRDSWNCAVLLCQGLAGAGGPIRRHSERLEATSAAAGLLAKPTNATTCRAADAELQDCKTSQPGPPGAGETHQSNQTCLSLWRALEAGKAIREIRQSKKEQGRRAPARGGHAAQVIVELQEEAPWLCRARLAFLNEWCVTPVSLVFRTTKPLSVYRPFARDTTHARSCLAHKVDLGVESSSNAGQ